MLLTVKVNGVKLDVYYTCQKTDDSYGTGDSPTQYEIDFNSIETLTDTANMLSIISEEVLMDIEQAVINFESEK
tara:strand:+ start:1635 stop:1856 length:222 start_codon:yes stop_codon:yes gene_type:complete